MREICKSGSMRGSGRSASNAPATLYSTGSTNCHGSLGGDPPQKRLKRGEKTAEILRNPFPKRGTMVETGERGSRAS